jgi:hypothetical protein
LARKTAGKFALTYVDRVERDDAALEAAVRTDIVEANP